MYQGWVTHTMSYLSGACPHHCSYCYVQAMARRFGMKRYSGEVDLVASELSTNLGDGKTIFVEHMNDLFADAVPAVYISTVLLHLSLWIKNTYVFQTKNPHRYGVFFKEIPANAILGTTIESNRHYPDIMCQAPHPCDRYNGMLGVRAIRRWKTFCTIEPILDFDVAELAEWLINLRLDFVNIGADSKGQGLPEPPLWKVTELISRLSEANIEVRKKQNLGRLLRTKTK